jgi:hypothetical protein
MPEVQDGAPRAPPPPFADGQSLYDHTAASIHVEADGAPTVAPYPGNWPLTNMTTQLFNLTADPTETNDLSKQYPEVVQQLLARIAYWATEVMVQPLYYNATVDPKSDPTKRNGTWYPWLP